MENRESDVIEGLENVYTNLTEMKGECVETPSKEKNQKEKKEK